MNILLQICLIIVATSLTVAQPFWERLPGPNATHSINCLKEDAAGGKLYAGTALGGGIYVSADNGATWSLKASGLDPNASILDIETDNAGNVYALGVKTYKSTNGGDTWEKLDNSTDGMTTLHITSGGVIFAGQETAVGNGITRSTDGGTTWEFARTGLPTTILGPFTYYRSVSSITSDGSGNLYCTVNGGNASTEAGVYKSTNNGDTWTRTSNGLLANVSVEPVLYSPNGMIYAAVRNRVYHSTDAGASWVLGDSIPMANSTLISRLAVNSSHQIFAGTTAGVFRAAKGGIGWASINVPSSSNYDFIVTSANAYLAAPLEIWGTHGGIHQSTDDGATWNTLNNGINNTPTFALKVGSSGVILNGLGGGRVEFSYDNGATFTRAYLSYTGLFTFAALAAFEENPSGTIVAATGEGLHTSTDQGVTWTKTSSVSNQRALTLDQSGNFFAANGSGAYKSTDNGQTWNSLGGGGDAYGILVTQAGTILTGTYNSGVNRTTDGGTTWTNSGTIVFGNVTIGKFVQLDNGTIYTHALLGIFKSTDDGATWAALTGTPIGVQSRKIESTGNILLLGTPEGLYKTIDGGANWTKHADGLMNTVLDHLSVGPDGRLYGAGGAGIYRTTNPITTGVELSSNIIPSAFELTQNYPNPFNPMTNFELRIANFGFVTLRIYDMLGKEVASLINKTLQPGIYKVSWDAGAQPSGVYFYRLTAGEFNQTKQMILIK